MVSSGQKRGWKTTASWVAFTLVSLGLLLTPFFLWERPIAQWMELSLQSGPGASVALLIAGVLAADVVLPVPSSIVSTAAGYLFGFPFGVALNWLGMTAGCFVAYWLGATAGRKAVSRFIGPGELARVSQSESAWGEWSIAVLRTVPILAEASVVYAGIRGMALGRFSVIAGLANLGVSSAYAAIGAWALSFDSFLLAFAGAIGLPALAMLLTRGRKN